MMPYIYFAVPSYGLMAALGFIVSTSWLFCKRIYDLDYEMSFRDFLGLILMCGVGCLIGSKLLYGLTQIPVLIEDCSFDNLIYSFVGGGFVFYGGLFGAYLGAYIFAKYKEHDISKILGFITPAFALFHAFGRIGCLLAGCCYGFHLDNSIMIGNVQFNYFPIQIVESVFEFIMFFILKRMKEQNRIFKMYLVCYSCFRFCAEFFRGDIIRGVWFGFSTSQWISIIIILYLMIAFYKKKLKKSIT